MKEFSFELQRFAVISNNYDSYTVISGTSGDDNISNGSQYSTILAGAGNDYISNSGARNIIDAGEGDDTVKNSGITSWSSINGGAGNDSIYNGQGGFITIRGGTGNDTIRIKSLYADYNVIQYSEGDGNDYFIDEWDPLSPNWTLQIGDGTGTYSSQTSGWDIIVTVGEGHITLANAANLSNVNIAGTYSTGGGGSSNSKLINGTSGDDYIENGEYYSGGYANMTIDGAEGNDTIYNYGDSVFVKGGSGNDTIFNNGDSVTIDGGLGNDYIEDWSSGAEASISGGDGNDTVYVNDNNSTVTGGTGDDYIDNMSGVANTLIEYDSGDGNDTIDGFNSTSTLQIDGGYGYYSTQQSGSDVIVYVEDAYDYGSITLVDAATLDNINIDGYEDDGIWDDTDADADSDSDYDDTYDDADSDSDFEPTEYNDTISNWEDYTTIDALGGDDSIYSYSYYTTIIGGTGDDTITLNSSGHDNIISYEYGDGNDLIQGLTSTDSISISGGTYYSVESGSDIILVVGYDSITVEGAATMDEFNVIGDYEDYEGYGDDADDTEDDTTDDTEDDTADDTEDDTADDTEDDTADDTEDDTTDDADAPDDVPFWRLEGKKAIYYPAPSEGDDPIVTVNGVKAIGGLTIDVDRKIVTVATSSLDESTVTINNGYSLALANGVASPSMGSEMEWSFSGTIATCKVSATTAGYMIEDNKINYVPAGTNRTIVLDGVSDYEGIKISGTTVTLSKKSLSGSTSVSINDGYTLALASDVDKPITMSGNLTYNGTAAIYKSSGTVAGYKVENNQVVYVPSKASEQVEISGVTSANGITRVDGEDTFIIPAAVLNRAKVKISEGYELALADDVDTPKTVKAGWSLEGTSATYSKSATQAGYSVSEDKESISYTPAVTGDTLVAVEGVIDTKGLLINTTDKSVTVYQDALNKTDVTISEGYSLKLSEQVDAPVKESIWTLEDTLAKYQSDATSEGYTLDAEENKIVYSAASEGEVKAELGGMDAIPTFNEAYDAIQLTEENFTDEGVTVVSNADGYGFEIAEGNYSHGTFTGSAGKDIITNAGNYISINGGSGKDSIVNTGANVSISGGEKNDKIINNAANVEISGGAGNDNVTVSGGVAGNIFSYSKGDGKDILSNFDEKDKIKIADNSTVEAEIDGSDIVFKIGTGSITIQDGAKTRRKVLFVGSDGKTEIDSLSGNEYSQDGIITYEGDGSESSILLAFTVKEYKADSVNKVDGSQIKRGVSIDGGAEGISLIGGKGKDTLVSGEQEFEMTGGKGNDLFVYNGGTGVITDYSQKGSNGKDKIELGESLNVQQYTLAGGNVILGFSDSDSLTIEDGVDKEITFGAKKSTVNVYTQDGVLDGNRKSIKLLSEKDSFDAKNYSKLVTIDGSAAEGEISLTGNKKKNYIVAGENGSTLSGGKGKDTLVGGDEADIFIYDGKNGKGNKTIIGYSNDDGDQIVLENDATISEVKAKGKDLVLKVGTNKITLKEIGDNPFTFVENNVAKTYSGGLLISADKESVSMTSAFGKTIDLSSEAYDETNYKNVSAASLKKAVSITGDTEDNILTGGKGKDTLIGGDGKDTLRGGKGNDVLWGGSPNENYNDANTFVFWAGDGKDTIMDYNFEQGDMIQILDKTGKKDAAFTSAFDDNTFTLKVKGGGKVILNNVSSNTSIKIGDTSKTIGQWIK